MNAARFLFDFLVSYESGCKAVIRLVCNEQRELPNVLQNPCRTVTVTECGQQPGKL